MDTMALSHVPVTTLILERGETGLGFNIRGGVDVPYVTGDTGIFVTRLKEDGAAFRDGRLKEGDKILEVNGRNIEKVTHTEAVQYFITAGNRVEMKVQHGAYRELMRTSRCGDEEPGTGNKVLFIILAVVAIAGIGAFIVMRQQQQA